MAQLGSRDHVNSRTAHRGRLLLAGLLSALLVVGLLISQLLPAPQAKADDVIIADGFDRTAASGWGRSPDGTAWSSMIGGSGTSVANSQGVVSGLLGGRSFRAYQPTVSVTDVSVRAEFTVPNAPELQYSIEGRKQADGSSYLSRARITGGKLHLDVMRNGGSTPTLLKELTLDTPTTAGGRLVLKLSATGSNPVVVQAKAYLAGQAEPGWLVTTLDSDSAAVTAAGHTGISVYSGAGNPTISLYTQSFIVNKVEIDTPTDHVVDPEQPVVAIKHGADKVGTATYPVPDSALFVSPSGSDSNTGTQAKPFKTVTKALTKNWSGQTIVLRAGAYHEYVLVPPGHAATIQPYPNEEVWFDGTKEVTEWQTSGARWVSEGWTTEFDHSPTYTKGAPDGTTEGWQFVNPARPMAAHPDQVWLDNVEQEQVSSLSRVTAGTFYVSDSTDALYLGSDPTGKVVRASDLAQAFSLRAPGTVLRGFGVRRFAGSVWQQGVITTYYERMTLDNMTITEPATAGIGFFKPNGIIKNTTVIGAGQVGIQAGMADNLMLDNVSVRESNDQQFNPAPSAGGMKLTMTRGITMKNSEIVSSLGNGFWTDQSCFQITLTNNEITGGTRWGIVLEISSLATIANNVIANNAYDGVLVTGTDKVSIWNNTIVNNRRAVAIVQDSRRITQPGVSGHDPRRTQPDMTMPWLIGDINVGNNIYSTRTDADSLYAVESYEKAFDASERNIYSNGNLYAQTKYGTPEDAVIWARKSAEPYKFVLLSDFTGNTGQERTSYTLLGVAPVSSNYQSTTAVQNKEAAVAQPLPSDVASKVGKPAGTKKLGAWR